MLRSGARSAPPVGEERSGPTVAILMAVRNGAATLPEQLASFARQTHGDWYVLAGDDGSDDASRTVLEDFAAQGHPLRVIDGPCRGAAANFLSLVHAFRADAADGTWMAFSDQDDVWLPDRIERGVAALAGVEGPALYCSRTWVTDMALVERRMSAPRPRPAAFRNALVQNIASGNTILLNAAAAAMVASAAGEAERVVVHDWWIYQLVTGAGGRVVHDDLPTVLYRQHGTNQIGANDGARARLRRIAMIMDGTFRAWNDINIEALQRSAHRLTRENRACLAAFADVRGRPLAARLAGLARLRLYRQSRAATLALWIAAALGRL